MEKTALVELIDRYKSDLESVYNTWFVGGEERMKAFRAFRRGNLAKQVTMGHASEEVLRHRHAESVYIG